jgi:alanine dehydrogenase
MKIGVAAENRPQEKRVILRPQELKGITAKHEVLVEKGAGTGIGVGNADYEKIGAKIADRKSVYGCDLVVRLKEPVADELKLMKPGSVIVSMLHLPSNQKLTDLLKKHKINSISLEEIRDPFGKRKVEALHQAGYLAMEKGFELWKGDPAKAVVKIMGYGNVAYGAIQCAARKFAKVIVLNKKDIYEMEKHIPGTDILVNAVNWPHEKRGKVLLVKQEMLRLFKKGSVIVDIVANPAGQSPIETIHPTSLDNISYEVDGIVHSACWLIKA